MQRRQQQQKQQQRRRRLWGASSSEVVSSSSAADSALPVPAGGEENKDEQTLLPPPPTAGNDDNDDIKKNEQIVKQNVIDYASTQSPPSSFFELQKDCIRAVSKAIDDGLTLLEIEYPPLPASVLEMDDVSSYEVSEANLKLAQDFAKGLLSSSSSSSGESDTSNSNNIKKIAILLPDEVEKNIAVKRIGTTNPYPNIIIDSIRRSDPDDDRLIKPENFLLNLFGTNAGGYVKPIDDVDLYMCLSISAQELPDIFELYKQLLPANKGNKDSEDQEQEQRQDPADETGKAEESTNSSSRIPTIILFNLKLDVLRGDLGAPAFPPREFHDQFLSQVKPVYYLRTRQYSRSISTPPFILNYQGCLFRIYPGNYQTLLDTGTGRYRRLRGDITRPPLGEFKKQLTNAVLKETGIMNIDDDEAPGGGALNFLRTGYKTTTWWEEEREDASDSWRT